jgi:hypothetical protein
LKISLIDLIRSAFGKKDENFRKRLSIFIVCVGISCIIWFTMKLSEEYDTVIQYPIQFTHLPKNKVLTFTSDSVLEVEIIEKGSNLFRMLYVNEPDPIEISLRFLPIYPKAGVYYGIITPSLLINEIERKKNLLGKVVSVSPDTIHLSFEPEKSRKVPVKAKFDLTFQKQFMRYGQSVFTPDCVTVRGPDRIIDNLDSISLGQIKLEQLNESYTGEKSFERDSLSQSLSFIPEEVSFTVPVEKFTETEISIPVKAINTNGLNVRLFPDKVKVVYTVALKDFGKIEPAMIMAYADLSTVNIAEDDKIKVDLESYPSFINIHRVEPEKVEFIIIK